MWCDVLRRTTRPLSCTGLAKAFRRNGPAKPMWLSPGSQFRALLPCIGRRSWDSPATKRPAVGISLPGGVLEAHRGKGLGTVLLLECLRSMKEMGYAYAIIGGVGPKEFYAKAAGAIEIPDSTPGIYTPPLGA